MPLLAAPPKVGQRIAFKVRLNSLISGSSAMMIHVSMPGGLYFCLPFSYVSMIRSVFLFCHLACSAKHLTI